MDEIKGVRFKCEVSVDVVELGIIVSHILSELGPFGWQRSFPQQHMVVLKARHRMDVKYRGLVLLMS